MPFHNLQEFGTDISILEDGVFIDSGVTSLNFEGAGVSVSVMGDTATITISGGLPGIAIGDTITDGDPNDILYVDSSGLLAQNDLFTYDPSGGSYNLGFDSGNSYINIYEPGSQYQFGDINGYSFGSKIGIFNQYLVYNSGGYDFLMLDPGGQQFQIGDFEGSGSGQFLNVNVGASSIIANTNDFEINDFLHGNGVAFSAFIPDYRVILGDVGGYANSTNFTVDDTNRLITAQTDRTFQVIDSNGDQFLFFHYFPGAMGPTPPNEFTFGDINAITNTNVIFSMQYGGIVGPGYIGWLAGIEDTKTGAAYFGIERVRFGHSIINTYGLGDLAGDTGLALLISDETGGPGHGANWAQLGDVKGNLNLTLLTVDDARQQIYAVQDGNFYVSGATNGNWGLSVDFSSGSTVVATIGDVNFDFNGTTTVLDDGLQSIVNTANNVFAYNDTTGNMYLQMAPFGGSLGATPTFKFGDINGATISKFVFEITQEASGVTANNGSIAHIYDSTTTNEYLLIDRGETFGMGGGTHNTYTFGDVEQVTGLNISIQDGTGGFVNTRTIQIGDVGQVFNGTLLQINDYTSGIVTLSNTFEVASATGTGTIETNNVTPNLSVNIGDINDVANGTRIYVDDGNQIINAFGQPYGTVGRFFTLDFQDKIYIIGDIDAVGNSNFIEVDDDGSTVTAQSLNFIHQNQAGEVLIESLTGTGSPTIRFGDLTASYSNTSFTLDDSIQKIQFQATNGISVTDTSGIKYLEVNPTTGFVTINNAYTLPDTVAASTGYVMTYSSAGTVTWQPASGGGSGTVTSVSVASANGFAGTVATSTTTPVITISTSITGMLKGNGTAISAATAGTDFLNSVNINTSLTGAGTTASALGLNLAHANTWSGQQTFGTSAPIFSTLTTNGGIFYGNGSGVLQQTGAGTGVQVLHGGTTPSYGAINLTTDVGNILPISNGGTGQGTATNAFNALAPAQSGHSGQFLTTNGTNTSWATVTSTLTIGQNVSGGVPYYILFIDASEELFQDGSFTYDPDDYIFNVGFVPGNYLNLNATLDQYMFGDYGNITNGAALKVRNDLNSVGFTANVNGNLGAPVFSINATTAQYQWGDIAGHLNGTNILMDDVFGHTSVTTGGYFMVRQGAGDRSLLLSYDTNTYAIGDLDGFLHSTYISINDSTQHIKVTNVPTYANDAAATTAGLVTGEVYKTTLLGTTSLNIVP